MAIQWDPISEAMINTVLEEFAREVQEGLADKPKRLSSKWFYDETGDELFVKIMKTPEYYLSDCELEIFHAQSEELIKSFNMEGRFFELIELGAGDGTKTLELLRAMRDIDFKYRPVDISSHALKTLGERVIRELPNIHMEGIKAEYFSALESLRSGHPKVVLFMGSNIGNLPDEHANLFLRQLSAVMQNGDKLLLGVDLKKSGDIVLPAYNDKQGYTAAFNLNLLDRINRELGGNFDLNKFRHAPEYHEDEGMALSFLESTADQKVRIEGVDSTFYFIAGEKIFMELSRKYNDDVIASITTGTGFHLVEKFYDTRRYFSDVVFEKR